MTSRNVSHTKKNKPSKSILNKLPTRNEDKAATPTIWTMNSNVNYKSLKIPGRLELKALLYVQGCSQIT